MMLTRKPMTRTGFKQPERPAKVARLLQPIRQDVSFEVAKLPVQHPKFEYIRSPLLLKACSLLLCQHCEGESGTVVAAHSNWSIHGKGRSIKASDVFVAALGHICHAELDSGKNWTEAEKKSIWWQAHCRTVQALVTKNLWPKDVAVPSLDWPETW